MKFLHVGCGQNDKSKTTDIFASDEWEETRLDIDESVKPDLVSSITDMSIIKDGSFNAVYSAHNIEHLYAHEVPIAFKEFKRVLKGDGIVFIRCPDLYTIAKFIVDGKVVQPMYQSPAGPVTPIDALFGMRPFLVNNPYMAHKIGFTSELLVGTLKENGFASAICVRSISAVELFAMASVNDVKEDILLEQMHNHLSTRLGENSIEKVRP